MPTEDRDTRSDVEAAIRVAFAGVRLGQGISLRQAAVIDDWGSGATDAEFRALPTEEVTDDWSAVPDDEIDTDNLAHMDAEGLRYYLPAFLLRLLRQYGDGAEIWTIGTIRALDQRDPHPLGFFELLTSKQRIALARYVRALPGLVELDAEDAFRIGRADRDIWARYLDDAADPRR